MNNKAIAHPAKYGLKFENLSINYYVYQDIWKSFSMKMIPFSQTEQFLHDIINSSAQHGASLIGKNNFLFYFTDNQFTIHEFLDSDKFIEAPLIKIIFENSYNHCFSYKAYLDFQQKLMLIRERLSESFKFSGRSWLFDFYGGYHGYWSL